MIDGLVHWPMGLSYIKCVNDTHAYILYIIYISCIRSHSIKILLVWYLST